MKSYTIVFPGEYGQAVQETWTENQIINYYFKYWSQRMIMAGKPEIDISRENCINDWCVVHWAQEVL